MNGEEGLSKVSEVDYTKPLNRLELSDKCHIISLLTTYHLFIKSKAAMDQFKEGLELFGVYQYIVKYPGILWALFVNERFPLTSSECKWQKVFIVMSLIIFLFYRSSWQHI